MDSSPSAPGSIVADLSAEPPYSPWLRLAHINLWEQGGSGMQPARVRVLSDTEFVLQLTGEAWLYLPALGGSVAVPEGSLCIIPPGLAHGQGRYRGDRHLAVHADLHAQPEIHAFAMLRYPGGTVQRADQPVQPLLRLRTGAVDVVVPLVIRLDDPLAWRRRFEPLVAQWMLRTFDRPAERLVAAGILAEVFADLLRLGARNPTDETPLAELLAKVDPSDRNLRVADLARRAGMGETAFRAAVHTLTGRSPSRWLEERRFETARRLLVESELPITAVATAVGYDDPFHFSRMFRRMSGRSPSDFRRAP